MGGGGQRGEAGWMLKVSPAARALFQVLLVFKSLYLRPCKTRTQQNVRGVYKNLSLSTALDALSAVHRTAETVTVLPVLSVPSSKVPSEERGENM